MTTSNKKPAKKSRQPNTPDRRALAKISSQIGVTPKKAMFSRAGRLISLDYSECGLDHLPSEFSSFVGLQTLNLGDNEFCDWPRVVFSLPALRHLDLGSNHLTEIPAAIASLTNLLRLDLGIAMKYNDPEQETIKSNTISFLPPEIGSLRNLQVLQLTLNGLRALPSEIGLLTNLRALFLGHNALTELPAEIGLLTELKGLYLHNNLLTELPIEVSKLTKLDDLVLARNQLKRLPLGLWHLSNLDRLDVEDNEELLTPPPEIVLQGQNRTLSFLRELESDSVTRYEAKMLLVGEGGTGKSSLVRRLRNDDSAIALESTHGIEVDKYNFIHPNDSNIKVKLNTWDFGGQEIYHATHQFFLTKRSLYLVVWNARLGAEQGRLNYWLDTIKALAPNSPVLLVATHIDERLPDINYAAYKDAFPQLIGNVSVSNLTGEGFESLIWAIAEAGIELPLMEQPWPTSWVRAETAILSMPDHHINFDAYIRCCQSSGVDSDIAQGTLGDWLHDLGKILYFHDDFVLSNLIVLKPNWVTKAISQVLTDEVTATSKGILSHTELNRIWALDSDGREYEPYLYPIFLRLMERFDLSYQIEADTPGDHPTRSLVPQLLPHQPPLTLPPWPQGPQNGETLLNMSYRLAFVPAGIMSWFIVRTHPYTLGLHWREGVLLEYEKHAARVELNPMLREVRFCVSGIQPHNFFTILKNTLDLILARFEGLGVDRLVPCICHWETESATPCRRFYRYEDLVRRMQAGKYTIECPDSFEDVSVPTLLYGIHTSTDVQVMEDIQLGQRQIMRQIKKLDTLELIVEKLNQQSELIARNFTRQWNLEMQKLEVECPNTFWLTTSGRTAFNPKDWTSKQYKLYLLCQHPQHPHTAGDGYRLRQADAWWKTVAPWLNQLVKFLKFAVPMGKALGAVHDENTMKEFETRVALMEQIVKAVPALKSAKDDVSQGSEGLGEDIFATGAALRGLHAYFDKIDPAHIWSGLSRAVTPDGNILWLCDLHKQQFEARPLMMATTDSAAKVI